MRFPKTKRDFEIDVMKAYCDGFMTACNQDVGGCSIANALMCR